MSWAGQVAGMGEKRNAYRILVGKSERKRPEDLDIGGRITLKWIRGIGWDGVDWTDLPQDRDQWWALVNMTMNFQVP
jgi:hypothetical protein